MKIVVPISLERSRRDLRRAFVVARIQIAMYVGVLLLLAVVVWLL